MAYLNEQQLIDMGFKSLGRNVKISDKASIYDAEQIKIGDNSRIDDFCVISGRVTIGRNVHIAVFCNIAGGKAGITICDFSGFSYGCHVFSQSDDYTGKTLVGPTVPDKYKKYFKQAVIIGRHSIIGANSLIFPGVILAEGTSVGALSMVKRSTQEWSIYVGIPARRLKSRKKDLLKLEKLYLEEEEQKHDNA